MRSGGTANDNLFARNPVNLKVGTGGNCGGGLDPQ